MVDDISLGFQRGIISKADIPFSHAEQVGPIIELFHLHGAAIRDGDGETVWLKTNSFEKLLDYIEKPELSYLEPGQNFGVISVLDSRHNEDSWTEFAMNAKRSAVAAGLSRAHGLKIIAAMSELRSNIIEHSSSSQSGQIIFAAKHRSFEFVVRDSGIGVLASLRQNPQYRDIDDSGTALELALSDGVTRHFEETGHGFGFRPVLNGLANISEHIRFRSGDYSREFVRNSDGSIVSQTKQRSQLGGFMCIVRCTPKSV